MSSTKLESTKTKLEFEVEEVELVEDYKNLVLTKPNNLSIAIEYLYESLVEEAVMGVAFQMHFESKFPEVFGASQEDSKKSSSSSHNDYSSNNNKFLNCKCLNCEKTVSANKYASHLENCLGIGRTSSRIASRKKTTNNSYYDYPEYDDDAESDANWSAKEKTKKKPQGSNGRNGKNKNKSYM